MNDGRRSGRNGAGVEERSRRAAPGGDDRPRRSGERLPPHNLDAEASLLGAVLLSKDAFLAVAETGLAADDFYKPAHQHLYEAARVLLAGGEPVDVVTVAEELRRADLLDLCGGTDYLLDLQAATPSISNAARYARIVQDTAVLRRLIRVASEIADLGFDEPDDVSKALSTAESKVFEIAERRVVDSTRPINELIKDAFDDLEKVYEQGDVITGTATGYTDLDELLSGLQPSTLNIVGARPAMGKCVAWDTPMVDPRTGAVRTAQEWYERGVAGEEVWCWSTAADGRLTPRRVGGFHADGCKPVFRVRTRSGRVVRVTAEHPLLTGGGWRPLRDVQVGTPIAVPRRLPVFGTRALADADVDLLALLLGGGTIGPGQSTPRFTGVEGPVLECLRAAAAVHGAELRFEQPAGRAGTWRIVGGDRGGRGANPVIELLRRHGAWGCAAGDTRVPPALFEAPRETVARFLNRLFATDGSPWTAAAGDARISYATVSEQLGVDVAHLLLRFGIRVMRRERWVRYGEERRRAVELEVMDAPSLAAFCDEIGILGKEEAVDAVRRRATQARGRQTATLDVLPIEVWDDVVKAKGDRSWADVNRLAGRSPTRNWHPYRRRPRRETIARLAAALDSDVLRRWASPDVAWDEVVAIEPCGPEPVYDFNVPGTHHFVAGDVIVHNTAFVLGMATHVAVHVGLPVLLFSLEMGHKELTQRILASEARIDSTKLRTGRLTQQDWSAIGKAIGRLEAPLYIDDNPYVTVSEIGAKARRLAQRSGGQIGLIVVDYLQLMTGRSSAENRQVEISEISRGLKVLARELRAPIVAASQLSRNLESRSDKRPMLADLRESGAIEQDADVVMFIYRDEVYNPESPDRGSAEIIVAKHRSGPIGMKRLAFLAQYTKFHDMAKGL